MKQIKVLLADDSETLLSALKIQLEAIHGFEVITCTNADTAVAYAQKHTPDVMVLDIRMDAERRNILSSTGDGLGVMERLAKFPELRGIPVIYMTGDQSTQLDFRAKQLGAFGVLHKPIVLPSLLNLIQSAVGPAGEKAGAAEDMRKKIAG